MGEKVTWPFGMQSAWIKQQPTVATTSEKFIFICNVNGGNGKQCAILFYQTNCSTRSKGTPFARDRLKLIFPEGPKGVGEGGLLPTVVDKKAHLLK